MEVYSFITTFFQSGGAFMYPIALVLAIGLAIAFERWLFLRKALFANRRAYSDLLPMFQAMRASGSILKRMLKSVKTRKGVMNRVT